MCIRDSIKVVCEYLNLDFERFNSTERTREIAQARQIAMYLSKQHTKAPLTTIGSGFNTFYRFSHLRFEILGILCKCRKSQVIERSIIERLCGFIG